nr:MAG TPA: hypothetical protein [Caudoviricetes sp.]
MEAKYEQRRINAVATAGAIGRNYLIDHAIDSFS